MLSCLLFSCPFHPLIVFCFSSWSLHTHSHPPSFSCALFLCLHVLRVSVSPRLDFPVSLTKPCNRNSLYLHWPYLDAACLQCVSRVYAPKTKLAALLSLALSAHSLYPDLRGYSCYYTEDLFYHWLELWGKTKLGLFPVVFYFPQVAKQS